MIELIWLDRMEEEIALICIRLDGEDGRSEEEKQNSINELGLMDLIVSGWMERMEGVRKRNRTVLMN